MSDFRIQRSFFFASTIFSIFALSSNLNADVPFRVVALGDFGYPIHAKPVAKAIDSLQQASQFEVNWWLRIFLGDNFYPNGLEEDKRGIQLGTLEDLYLGNGLPSLAILGNHDHMGPRSAEWQIGYTRYSPKIPDRDIPFWHMPASYYDYWDKALDAHFFVFDTTQAVEDEMGSANFSQQIAALDEKMRQSTANWKIVLGHHPIVSDGGQDFVDSRYLRELTPLRELVLKYAHAYIAGHAHHVAHLEIEGTGPAVLQIISGAGGNDDRVFSFSWNRAKIRSGTDDSGFTCLDFTATNIVARAFVVRDEAAIEIGHSVISGDRTLIHHRELAAPEELPSSARTPPPNEVFPKHIAKKTPPSPKKRCKEDPKPITRSSITYRTEFAEDVVMTSAEDLAQRRGLEPLPQLPQIGNRTGE